MHIDKPVTTKLSAMRKDMLRGDSLFAVIIFAVVALFLFNLVASIWNNVVFQKGVQEKASVQHFGAVGSVLAKASETLMVAHEISMLRRTVAEAGVEHKLRSCRIVLPDGGVLADADPACITVIQLPETWEGEVPEYTEEFSHRGVRFSYPLRIPGRGNATLEVAARSDDPSEAGITGRFITASEVVTGCPPSAAEL